MLHGRPSVDDRYALGYCDTCDVPIRAGQPRKWRDGRPTVQLIRADRFDRAAFERARASRAMADIFRRFRAGKRLTDAEWDVVQAAVVGTREPGR